MKVRLLQQRDPDGQLRNIAEGGADETAEALAQRSLQRIGEDADATGERDEGEQRHDEDREGELALEAWQAIERPQRQVEGEQEQEDRGSGDPHAPSAFRCPPPERAVGRESLVAPILSSTRVDAEGWPQSTKLCSTQQDAARRSKQHCPVKRLWW